MVEVPKGDAKSLEVTIRPGAPDTGAPPLPSLLDPVKPQDTLLPPLKTKDEIIEGLAPEELDTKAPLPDDQPELPPGVTPFDPEKEPIMGSGVLPEGVTPFVEDEPTSMIDTMLEKGVDRFLGMDVDDPIPWWRAGSQFSGALGGAYYGSRIGAAVALIAPPLAVPATIVGTMGGGAVGLVAGSVAPEAGMVAGEFLGLLDPKVREDSGLSNTELKTLVEGEVILEIWTLGGLSAARALIRQGVKHFTGLSKETAMKAMRAAAHGILLTPVQLGGKRFPIAYISVFGRMPVFFSGKARQALGAVDQAIKGVVTGMPGRMAAIDSWSTISRQMFKDAQLLIKRMNEYFEIRYQDLWKEGEALGVAVSPKSAIEMGYEIVRRADKKRASQVQEMLVRVDPDSPPMIVEVIRKADYDDGIMPVIKFIEKEIAPMVGELSGKVRNQTHLQLDNVLTKLDQKIAELEKDPLMRWSINQLMDLRNAIRYDAVENALTPAAREFGEKLRALDQDFSTMMMELMDNSIAQRFGTVTKKGLRGKQLVEDATRVPVDQLAKYIAKNLQSVEEVEQLAKLVGKKTFKRIAARYIDNAVERATVLTDDGAGVRFSPNQFAKWLGLTEKVGDKKAAITKMLEIADTGLTITDLEDVVEFARLAGAIDIPKVSTYLARRGTIGGLSGLVNSVLPAAAVGAAAGSGGMKWFGVHWIISGLMITSSRGISRAITNPENAMLFKEMLAPHASRAVRQSRYLTLMNNMIEAGIEDIAGERRARNRGPNPDRLKRQLKADREALNEALRLYNEGMNREADLMGIFPGEER